MFGSLLVIRLSISSVVYFVIVIAIIIFNLISASVCSPTISSNSCQICMQIILNDRQFRQMLSSQTVNSFWVFNLKALLWVSTYEKQRDGEGERERVRNRACLCVCVKERVIYSSVLFSSNDKEHELSLSNISVNRLFLSITVISYRSFVSLHIPV